MGAMTDDDVAALAAEIALTYPGATGGGGLHALNRDRTLCGQGGDALEKEDQPFSPLAPNACGTCAATFETFAAVVPGLELAGSWKDLRPRSGYHNQLKQQFAMELEAEVAPDHLLAATALFIVANAEDDVVVVRADGGVAVVRLTWSREIEAAPKPFVAHIEPDATVAAAADLALGA